MNPPARNAMWRFGFPTAVNYNDNELFCGGYAGKKFRFALTYAGLFLSIKYSAALNFRSNLYSI